MTVESRAISQAHTNTVNVYKQQHISVGCGGQSVFLYLIISVHTKIPLYYQHGSPSGLWHAKPFKLLRYKHTHCPYHPHPIVTQSVLYSMEGPKTGTQEPCLESVQEIELITHLVNMVYLILEREQLTLLRIMI